MPIITISRGSYSRGKEVAENVAQRLGFTCISREVLLEASTEFNIEEIKLIRALHDAPSVLERFKHGKTRYLSYYRYALLKSVRQDNVVYHGLAGHFLLERIPHVLKVRITANLEDRVREEMRREDISEEKARYILKKDDEERRRWGLQIHGVDTWDSRLYDIVLHLSSLTIDDAVDTICTIAQKPQFQANDQSRRLIDDLSISAEIEAKICEVAPRVEACFSDGVAYIFSPETEAKLDAPLCDQIETIAREISGVNSVVFQNPMPSRSNYINPYHNI